MVISDETYFPILIESIDVPTKTEFYWVLSLSIRDFILSKLLMFEELTVPALELEINGYNLTVPTDWNILVYSPDTSQIDIVEISDLTRGDFTALVFAHDTNKVIPGKIKVTNYKASIKVQTPSLKKDEMLCHPLGNKYWACLSPSDNYNKFLKDAVIGDLT